MKIKIGNEKLKISKNKLNRFWNPIGMFYNQSEIKIDGEWYRCYTNFLKKQDMNYIQVLDPFQVYEKTATIKKFHTKGIYKEFVISKFKSNFLQCLLNTHKINRLSYDVRKIISERRYTLYVVFIALTSAITYYILNDINDNSVLNYIAKNNWAQTIIIFLTISSFINIFYPFTIKKQLDKKDIELIAKETQKKEKEKEEWNKEVEKRATL